MVEKVRFDVEVETDNIANNFKRNDLFRKYSERHSIAEFR